MSDVKFKWAIIGLIAAALGLGGFLLVQKVDGWLSGDARVATVAQQQLELARQFKELQAGVVQAQVTMGQVSIEAVERMGAKVAEAIKATGAKPVTTGQTTASWKDGLSRRLGVASDKVAGEGQDHYYFKKVTAQAADGRTVPVAWVMFYPERENPWKTGVYDLRYHADIVRAKQPDGGFQNYVHAYLTNDQDAASKGQKYPLDLKAEFQERWADEAQFFWWAPRIVMGAFVSQDAAAGMGLGASLMGYGRSVADLDWRFLGLYALKDADNLRLGLEPFAWRLPLPFLHNTYLSPLLTFDWRESLGSPTPGAALMVGVTF